MHTRAIVIPEPNRVELREVALTAPGATDLVVETAYTSISAGTERMLLAGRMPHPMLSLPVVPGYETVGKVVAAGPDAPQELIGRWVYVGGARCYVDLNPAWGGQAARLHVEHTRVVPLDGVEPEQGVLLALAATALHGVDLLADLGLGRAQQRQASAASAGAAPLLQPLLAGTRILVLGQGPVGQLAARLARGRGAWVAATDRNRARLALSAVDLAVNSAEQPLAEQLGGPVDAIIEATGSMAALAEALPLLANGGTLLLLGYYDELRLPYMPLFLKQARLLTAREWGPGDPARCRDLIASGELDVTGLITHRLPISEAAHAYETALHDAGCLKLLLEW